MFQFRELQSTMDNRVLIKQFIETCVRHPGRTAVVSNGKNTSYGELFDRVTQIRSCLNSGIGSDHVVLALPAGVDYVACVLACIGESIPFLPVSEEQFSTRLNKIQKFVNCETILTNSDHEQQISDSIDSDVTVLNVNGLDDSEKGSFETLRAETDLVYLIATSGSTGEPKLVQASYRLLVEFIQWEIDYCQIVPGDRVSLLTPVSFDVSLRDVLVPLTAGATLCIPPQGTTRHPKQLLQWLQEQQITLFHMVPTLLRQITKVATTPCLPDLRWALIAGEP